MSGEIDLARALSFGASAEQYERARPSYPAALVDDLVALRPGAVLDIGTGTGKAAELLLARGLDVLAVEPDARMAAVARRKGIAVEESTFESWDPRGRRFDLITAAQSWHWMPQPTGARRAFELVRESGHLAAFWNLDVIDEGMRAALEPVYRQLAPDLLDDNAFAQPPELAMEKEQHAGPLQAAGFAPVEVHTYAWAAHYSTQEWIDGVATHSDHATLPEPQRRELLEALANAAERAGDSVTCSFTTVLLLATRGVPQRARDVP